MNPTAAPTTTPDAPKPMPFAIMRNAHEALRASIRLQAQALESADLDAFTAEWQRLRRGLAVHMSMEDRAMFALLDEASGGAITAAALPAEHDEDVRLAAAVDAALAAGDTAGLRSAWLAWQEEHLRHLEHEEAVMMPLTMKTASTPEGRARVVHERLLTPSAEQPDFDWFVGWVISMLSRHGSSAQPAAVATRVFAWGLQHASSPAQWQRFRPIVERNCPPGLWADLAVGFGLDGEGKIT
jgi:hypothetical protein